jgi:ABC-2 type transport system ATP-binding protein
VDGVNLELRRGEILGFLGPNGAGKTTTMQMLTGNLAPTAGSVRICGADLLAHPRQAKAHVGYLPEQPPLYRELTVREYVDLAARLRGVTAARRKPAVESAIARCGLTEVARQLIGTLSKGYQQRVGIAQAIVHEPDVIILDEPTVGLDPNQIREIRTLIRELGRHSGVILSTHILPEVETVCDRVQIMHHGSLVYDDTIAGLRRFESGRVVTVGLRRPPLPAAIAAIGGVAAVERAGQRHFRVTFAEGQDPLEALVERSVREDWGLYELAPAQTSLEDVFAHLTRKEPEAAAA